MTAGDSAGQLNSLVKSLRGRFPGTAEARRHEPDAGRALLDPAEPIIAEFFRSFMLWESTLQRASSAVRRFEEAVVDFNELRVCLPEELVRIMGERYPRAEERALRLKSALNAIYTREHAVSLECLTRTGKRECREYLDALEGAPRFVAARVELLCLGAHSAPVDSRLLARLREARAVGPEASASDAAALLERKVRAGELLETYSLLQAWSDELPLVLDGEPRLPRSPRPPRSTAAARPARPTRLSGNSGAGQVNPNPAPPNPGRKPKPAKG